MLKKIVLFFLVTFGMEVGFCGQNTNPSPENVRIKTLLDKVNSMPVSLNEAKSAFKNEIREICVVNGKSTTNGFGTTEECLSKLDNHADPTCSELVIGRTRKEYRSREDLTSDFKKYFACAAKDIDKFSK